MTLKQLLFDGQTDGTTATSAMFTGNELFTVTAPSTMQFSTSDGMRGTSGLHLNIGAGTGADVVRLSPMNADNAQAAFSFIFRTPASNPAGFAPMLSIRSTGGRACTVGIASNGRLYVADGAGGGGTATYVTSVALTASTKYRCELRLVGNTTTAGKIDCAVYNPTDTTGALYTLTTITNANLRAELLHGVEIGQNGTGMVAIDFGIDDLQMDDGRTTEIGPVPTTLSTPTVSSGTLTNPSVVGGTDGSAVATWSAVSNATSYEAWKATKASPAQGDFTLVATGVTSPYTFTGLGAGTYSIGIKAKGTGAYSDSLIGYSTFTLSNPATPKLRVAKITAQGAGTNPKLRVANVVARGTVPLGIIPIPDAMVEAYSTVAVSALPVSSFPPSTAFAWRQISGPSVTFADNGTSITFAAPTVMAGTVLVFGVTPSVGSQTSPEVTATVNVLPHIFWLAGSTGWQALTRKTAV